MPGDTLSKKLENLEKLGFVGIELWGRQQLGEKIREVKEAFASYKVRPSVICAGYGGDLLSPETKMRQEAIEGIIQRLKWASEIGAVGVIFVPTFGGPKLPDLSPLYPSVVDLEKRLLVSECKVLAKEGENQGVCAILEPLNRYETHLINRLEQGLEIVEEVGSAGLRLMADFFHMNIEESNVSEALLKASKYIVHVHLADSNRVLPGYGHTDFTPIRTLLSKGYDKYFSLECRIPGDPLSELRKFVEFISRYR
ncbi:MAG: sugar phosphate isomerase/epimerase family protein [Nitrososphaerota archaeon]|nr:sugar phosphate isomerase/epimerase family protein [Nitrososphaerota archaeon]